MKKLTILVVGLIILLPACKTGKTDQENIDKLLETQAEMQQVQEESVEQLGQIKDSLDSEKRSLLDQREAKDREIQQMEKNQQVLADKLKEEQALIAASEKEELEQKIAGYKDSINQLQSELSSLDTQLDSVEESMELYALQETRSEISLESGIAEIDQRMTRRENRQQMEIKRIGLLERRIAVSEKKIEALEMERQLYIDERDELRRNNASDEDLATYDIKISDIDKTIRAEKDNKVSMQVNLQQAKDYIAETDSIMDDLRTQIKEEYDKKEIIESFIASEKERLHRELAQLQQSRKELLAEQANVSNNLTNTEEQIEKIDRNVELIRSKQMSEILEKQAELERSEAKLAEEEISMLEEETDKKSDSKVSDMSSDSASEELLALETLGKELD
jgi:chromosome segregation ATPase